MDPAKIYFSDKQLDYQVKYVLSILHIPLYEEYYNICHQIIKQKNQELYNKYIKKKPNNIPLDIYLGKLNKKSSLDSAIIFYKQYNKQYLTANISSDNYASIYDIGTTPLGRSINNNIQTTRLMPNIQDKQIMSYDNILKQRELETQMIMTNGRNIPKNTDPSIFLDKCDYNDKMRLKHSQSNNQVQQQNLPQNTQQTQTQINNDNMGAFLATDIFNNSSFGTDINNISSSLLTDDMKKQMKDLENNKPVNSSNLQQYQNQRNQDMLQSNKSYHQQLNFNNGGVNSSPPLTNKKLSIMCDSKVFIPQNKPKNIFSIRSTNNNLIDVKCIKLYNFNNIPHSCNINNENNCVSLDVGDEHINFNVDPGNYDINELLEYLNNKLSDFILEFNSPNTYNISIKYLSDDDKNITFTLNNLEKSIFRVLGFTDNIYSDKTEYISEQHVCLPKDQPFYMFMIINNDIACKFNIIDDNRIYKKTFKTPIKSIDNITFIFKQENNQLYDCDTYITFNIDIEF